MFQKLMWPKEFLPRNQLYVTFQPESQSLNRNAELMTELILGRQYLFDGKIVLSELVTKHPDCIGSGNIAPRQQLHPSSMNTKTQIIISYKDLRRLL